MGVDALRLGVREGLEEGREGEVVGEDGVAAHVGVDGQSGFGLGKGSDEGVEDVYVGGGNQAAEQNKGRL
ncbi:hypothetical protein CR513_51911, partial [Mucuna pruriens]